MGPLESNLMAATRASVMGHPSSMAKTAPVVSMIRFMRMAPIARARRWRGMVGNCPMYSTGAFEAVAQRLGDATRADDENIACFQALAIAAVDDLPPDCAPHAEQNCREDHQQDDDDARDHFGAFEIKRAAEQKA